MLNRGTMRLLLFASNDPGSHFHKENFPAELLRKICGFETTPEGNIQHPDFLTALQHAADGKLIELKAMLDENPLLLVLRGNVSTAEHTSLLEFALLDGDEAMAEMILPCFDLLANGWAEREKQKARCRPYIESLKKLIELALPTLDLRPLFDIIKQASFDDVTAALTKNMAHESQLRDALIEFRHTVKHKSNNTGLHYEHYTTLAQAFDLLCDEWNALINNNIGYAKCYLICRQVIGYLQRGLPFIDRCAFARAFADTERRLELKYPNAVYLSCDADDTSLTGLGFDMFIYGRLADRISGYQCTAARRSFFNHMYIKILQLAKLVQPEPKPAPSASSCLIL